MKKRFFSIETRSLFSMVLLPLLILGIAVSIVNSRVLCKEIDQSDERQMRYVSERFAGFMQDLERLNQSLTTNPAVTLRLKRALQHAAVGGIYESEYAVYNAVLDLIYASAYRNAYIDSIYIYFEDGGEFFISSKKRLTNLHEYWDVGWFDAYQRTDPFVPTWIQPRTAKGADGQTHQLLTIYHRIFAGGTGSDRGVLVLNIDRQHVNEMLKSVDGSWKTSTAITDSGGGNVLFSNALFDETFGDTSAGTLLKEEAQDLLTGTSLCRRRVKIGEESYVCLSLPMGVYGWKMLRLSPSRSLYAAPMQMVCIHMIMLACAMAFGVLFSRQLAIRNNRDIDNVIRSIQLAKAGQPVQANKGPHRDYSDMLQNVVDTFLEKEYLTVQLAERKHHAELLELQALQSQLNPHFLYNTMSVIQWKAMALTGSPNDASEMIEHLSDLLHYVLDTGTELTTLRDELRATDSYAAVQRIRYGDQFIYEYVCDDALLEARVMKMLLQPLVENSIAHGMNHHAIHVRVTVEEREGVLCIFVDDNGEGMDERRLAQVRDMLTVAPTENGRHIGLYNVNKRIALTYGEMYGLRIDSAKGKGTHISLRLPLTIPQRKTREE